MQADERTRWIPRFFFQRIQHLRFLRLHSSRAIFSNFDQTHKSTRLSCLRNGCYLWQCLFAKRVEECRRTNECAGFVAYLHGIQQRTSSCAFVLCLHSSHVTFLQCQANVSLFMKVTRYVRVVLPRSYGFCCILQQEGTVAISHFRVCVAAMRDCDEPFSKLVVDKCQ